MRRCYHCQVALEPPLARGNALPMHFFFRCGGTSRFNPRQRLEEAATLKLGADAAISKPQSSARGVAFHLRFAEGFTGDSGTEGLGIRGLGTNEWWFERARRRCLRVLGAPLPQKFWSA